MTFTHYPVMATEIINYITCHKPKNVLDCTFGLGGHTSLILKNTDAIVTAIDWDINTLPWVENLQKMYPDRLIFINKSFGEGVHDLIKNNLKFDWILGDFGISSMQLDDNQRGFSFSKKGPLSMAMDMKNSKKCQWLINESSVRILAEIIRDYGEEKNYYHIAKAIVHHRPIKDTIHLASVIEEKIFHKQFTNKTLARVFQAIRIYTNDELNQIRELLNNINKISHKNTGFSWLYFHSLEGNEVHKWYKNYKTINLPMVLLKPTEEELKANSRSRSAVLMIIKPKELL